MRTYRLYEEELPEPGERLTLTASNAHIVRRVLRLKSGDRVQLCNGQGGVAASEIVSAGAQRATVFLLDRKEIPPNWPVITLYQGLPKGEKSKWVVQKGVEFGVTRIVFFEGGHRVARAGKGQAGRWKRVAVEAMRQSGNPHLPEILGPAPLSEVLPYSGEAMRISLDESEESRLFADMIPPSPPSAVHVAVGPEGGWSDDDRRILAENGFQSVRLGRFILRTETASVASLAACRAVFG